MKLIIAIIQDEDTNRLIKTMLQEGFSATKLSTTGGFLRAGNSTLLIGVEDERLDSCFAIIEKICKSRTQKLSSIAPMGGVPITSIGTEVEITVGGATVFILPVEGFKKI